MIAHKKFVAGVIPLLVVGVFLFYSPTKPRRQRYSRESDRRFQPTDTQYSVYRLQTEAGECHLFRNPDHFQDDIRSQMDQTFSRPTKDSPGLCVSLNSSCFSLDVDSGLKWTYLYHCLSLVDCEPFVLLYIKAGMLEVLSKTFSRIEDLTGFLSSEQYISEPAVYAYCTGRYHSLLLNHTCVNFRISRAQYNVVERGSQLNLNHNSCNSDVSGPKARMDIDVIYLHFIGLFQFMEWLPMTYGILRSSSHVGKVFGFKKYQSVCASDLSFLSTFFYGTDDRDSLLVSAAKSGYRTRIFDMTCRSSFNRTRVLQKALCDSYQNNSDRCRTVLYQGTQNGDICQNGFVNFRSPVVEYLLNPSKESGPPSLRLHLVSLMDIRTADNLASLDALLSRIVLKRLGMTNSITLIVSDVGYMFTTPPPLDPFDHSVLSNPVLFLALSDDAAKALSGRELTNMKANQDQLISMIDIHFTVKRLITRGTKIQATSERSLFAVLSHNRNCRSLGVSPPNMCICENQSVMFENDTLQVGFADFVVGTLNNKHNRNYEVGVSSQRLFFQGFQFFQPRLSSLDGALGVSSVIVLGKYVTSPEHIFHGCVAVEAMAELNCTRHRGCHVTRLSHTFVESQSTLVQGALRNCAQTLGKHFYHIPTDHRRLIAIRTAFQRHFGVKQRQYDIFEGCVFIIVSDFVKSVSFSVLNQCETDHISIEFNLIVQGMISLSPLPVIEEDVAPLELLFLSTAVQSSYFGSHRSVRFKAHVQRL